MPRHASIVFSNDAGTALDMVDEGSVESRLKYLFRSPSIAGNGESLGDSASTRLDAFRIVSLLDVVEPLDGRALGRLGASSPFKVGARERDRLSAESWKVRNSGKLFLSDSACTGLRRWPTE
jgi:hypothetical protein